MQLFEKTFGYSIGSYTTSAGWCTGCFVDSTAAASRRSVDLTINYEAGVYAALESNATAAANTMTAASFNADLASINAAETLVASSSLPGATFILAATSSDSSGSFGNHWFMGIIAVMLMVILLMISFCAIHRFKQSTKKPEVDVHMDQKTTV